MSPASGSPVLSLTRDELVRSLEVRRPADAASVSDALTERLGFAPTQMLLRWSQRRDTSGSFREESCAVLCPSPADEGVFARWDSSYTEGQEPMPSWLAEAYDDVHQALNEGAAHHEGDPVAVSVFREYSVTGAVERLFSYSFAPDRLTISWSWNGSAQSGRYRISLYCGAEPSGQWDGTRGGGYKSDVPDWVRDASEALLAEMEPNQ